MCLTLDPESAFGWGIVLIVRDLELASSDSLQPAGGQDWGVQAFKWSAEQHFNSWSCYELHSLYTTPVIYSIWVYFCLYCWMIWVQMCIKLLPYDVWTQALPFYFCTSHYCFDNALYLLQAHFRKLYKTRGSKYVSIKKKVVWEYHKCSVNFDCAPPRRMDSPLYCSTRKCRVVTPWQWLQWPQTLQYHQERQQVRYPTNNWWDVVLSLIAGICQTANNLLRVISIISEEKDANLNMVQLHSYYRYVGKFTKYKMNVFTMYIQNECI